MSAVLSAGIPSTRVKFSPHVSIYATLWILKFPARGDSYVGCEWETVMAQGVPEVSDDEDAPLRAVVFIRQGTEKVFQEYTNPLLVLTGAEYAAMSFDALHERICDALRGEKPRVIAQLFTRDGESELICEGDATKP